MAPVVSRDGRRALVTVVPRHDGESDAAKALVVRLRDRLAVGGGASAAASAAAASTSAT